MNDGRHQFEHAARALEAFQRGPVLVEAVEQFGVDRIGRFEARLVEGLTGFGRELGFVIKVHFRKGAADGIAGGKIRDWLEEAAAHDFE